MAGCSFLSQVEKVDFKDLFSYPSEMMLFQRLTEREAGPEMATKITALWMWFQTEAHGENLTTKISENDDERFFSSLVEESMAILAILDSSSTTPFSPDLFPTCATLLNPSFDAVSEIFSESKETVSKRIEDLSKELIYSALNDFEKKKGHTFEAEVGQAEEENKQEDGEKNPDEVNDGREKASSEDDSKEPFQLNPNAQEWRPEATPEESRCLFLTFSKGHPLTEPEILYFFARKYGQCIQRIYIHRPENRRDPPLFGKVVFSAVSIVAMVLGGKEGAKFVINGRPLWFKKYDARRARPAAAEPEN